MKNIFSPLSVVALMSVATFVTACKKDKKECGCDAASIETFSNRSARLAYDSTYKEYVLFTAPDSVNFVIMNSICNVEILPDSIKKNYTNTPKLLSITGESKLVCKENKKTLIANYSQGLVKIQEIHGKAEK